MTETMIRKAAISDAKALATLSRVTFVNAFGHFYAPVDLKHFLKTSYSRAKTRAALSDPEIGIWLLEADGRAVGYVQVGRCALPHPEVTPACGEIKRIYLLPEWQSGGGGARLLETALAWLERDGPRPVWLGVYFENIKAQRFYSRYGFEKVGEYGFVVGEAVDREFILRRG